MFANEKELVVAHNERGRAIYDPRLRDHKMKRFSNTDMTEEQAREILDACKAACLSGNYYGKENNRPWELVDFSSELSNSSAWVGFEFEMGFHDDETRRRVVNWMWDSINHSAQDAEGHGSYVLEATFKPQNFEEYNAGTADIQRLYNYIKENNIDLYLPTKGTGMCGTHANISTPLLRKCSDDQCYKIVQHLSKLYSSTRPNNATDRHPANGETYSPGTFNVPDTSPGKLNEEHKLKFFGRRSPYGWCNFRQSGHYIEFKVFASTDDYEQFMGDYQATTAALIECIDTLAEQALAGKEFDLGLLATLEKHHTPVKKRAAV